MAELVVQRVWQDQLFSANGLATTEGKPLRVLSPGWWNRGEGPDFKGAHIEFGGVVRTGDVEIHLDHGAWRGHGHHADRRYDDVMLVVVLDTRPPPDLPRTSNDRAIPVLLLGKYIDTDLQALAEAIASDEYPEEGLLLYGRCAAIAEAYGTEHVRRFLVLAGEWRMVNKARALRERMDRAGPDQALYELFLSACGYSRFKDHFRAIAQHLPFDRIAQLANLDPMLVETALLQIAGLLPERLPKGAAPVGHFERLDGLRRNSLPGLRSLPLTWERTGVRPINYPERRLAGAARFLGRAAKTGLSDTLDEIWQLDMTPAKRRKAFETLFPAGMGFWAEHCTWTGRRLTKATAPLGRGRILSIIGNVFVPAGLARARRERNRALEERIHEFFAALPKEADNRIVTIMAPRVFGRPDAPKVDFRLQQGLLQVYQDWCEPNPSCRNCAVIRYLDLEDRTAKDIKRR